MTPAEAEAVYHSITTLLESKQGRAVLAQGVNAAPLQELRAAAEAGYAPAQYAYADLLDVLGQSSLDRLPWLLRAAQQGHEDARDDLHALYATDAVLRARVRNQLTTEQVEALGLNQKYSAPAREATMMEPIHPVLGTLAFLGCGAMAVAIVWHMVNPLAELLSREDWTLEEWAMLLLYLYGFFFILTFLIALPLEMWRRGSAEWNPFVGGSFALSFACVSLGFLSLGAQDLVLAYRAETQGVEHLLTIEQHRCLHYPRGEGQEPGSFLIEPYPWDDARALAVGQPIRFIHAPGYPHRGYCPGIGMRVRWWLPGAIMSLIGALFALLLLKLVSNYIRRRAGERQH